MGQWNVNPNKGVVIDSDINGRITFPKNTGTTEIIYPITYTDDNGCVSSAATYISPICTEPQPQEYTFTINTDYKGAIITWKDSGNNTLGTVNMGNAQTTSITRTDVDTVYAWVDYSKSSCIQVTNNPVEITCNNTGNSVSVQCCKGQRSEFYEPANLEDIPWPDDENFYITFYFKVKFDETEIDTCFNEKLYFDPEIIWKTSDCVSQVESDPIASYSIKPSSRSVTEKTGYFNFKDESANREDWTSIKVDNQYAIRSFADAGHIGKPNTIEFKYACNQNHPQEHLHSLTFEYDSEGIQENKCWWTYVSKEKVDEYGHKVEITFRVSYDSDENSIKYDVEFSGLENLHHRFTPIL